MPCGTTFRILVYLCLWPQLGTTALRSIALHNPSCMFLGGASCAKTTRTISLRVRLKYIASWLEQQLLGETRFPRLKDILTLCVTDTCDMISFASRQARHVPTTHATRKRQSSECHQNPINQSNDDPARSTTTFRRHHHDNNKENNRNPYSHSLDFRPLTLILQTVINHDVISRCHSTILSPSTSCPKRSYFDKYNYK